jgi:hypothetical protein
MQLALLASHLEIDPQNNRFWTRLDAKYPRRRDFGRGNLVERCPLAFVPGVQISGVALNLRLILPTAS